MLSLSPDQIIASLQALPPEAVLLLLLLFCFLAILAMLRLFGEAGLYVYIVIAIIGANLQVMKQVQFPYLAEAGGFLHLPAFGSPVALGTVLFSSTFLCTDILTEHFGRRVARRAVLIGFAGYLIWTGLVVLTLGFRPMTGAEAGEGLAWALGNHDALAALYTPAPALFAAGMVAYLVSQFHDIWIFRLIGVMTRGRHLWLRNNASTMISGLVDNTIFSVLAWVVFAAQPMAWQPLVFTFILGTYVLRVAVAALDTPFLYLARFAIHPQTFRLPEQYE
ncbi:MAG: queuosine precursor transporter [Inquilinus sp.]|nr:queuosine precursor transporter [Inquilinus sp.]